MNFRLHSFSAIASLALFALVIASLGAVAVVPYLYFRALDVQASALQVRLSEHRKLLVQEGDVRKENEHLLSIGQEASLLLEGETTGIAGANLQKLINDVILAHKGNPASARILNPKEDGELVRIGMSLSIVVGIDGLRDILHSIETGTPLIFIDDISVHTSQDVSWAQPDPHYLGPLDVTLQVSGYALKNGTPSP